MTARVNPLEPLIRERMISMNKRKRTVGINIRVTPQEKKRIGNLAGKCRLSVSEYLRQLAMGSLLPDKDIYHDCILLQHIINNTDDPALKSVLQRILIDLYSLFYPEREVKTDGNNKNMACS